MTFEQAKSLFEIVAAELKNQGVLGFRHLSGGKVELHDTASSGQISLQTA